MTGIPAVYLLLGICVVTVAGLAAGYGAQRLARLAGILFPLYQTFRALELGDEDDLERRLLWLRYWVVFAVLQCASLPFDFILGGTVPYYFMGKTLLTIALFFPSHSAVTFLYSRVLQPLLSHHDEFIAEAVESAQVKASALSTEIASVGLQYLPLMMARAIALMASILQSADLRKQEKDKRD